jgi:hypothetical protein
MKKSFVKLALGVGSLCALAAPMFAETYSVKVTVPFAFSAGAAELPAGEYMISPLTGFGSVLLIEGAKAKAIVMTQSADGAVTMGSSVSFSEGERKSLLAVAVAGRRYELARMTPELGAVKPLVSLRSK